MRLVDLHCDWLRQYATETTLYEGGLYSEIPGRVGRLDGYLLGTSLSVLACARKPEDWSSRPDPWDALGLMIARYEAEFAGRLLLDSSDVARWRSSPADGMCWGVLGVSGFDFLVRSADDLDRLPALFARGVRVWQPVAAGGGALGGANVPGDDRGLTDLGRAFLDRLAGLGSPGDAGPRPILDLAGMSVATTADTLRWYDGVPRGQAPLPIAVTHGTGTYVPFLDGSTPEARLVAEVRMRGGVIGLTPGLPGGETVDAMKTLIEAVAAVPVPGRSNFEGLAIGTDPLGIDRGVPGLASAREIARWLGRSFDRGTAAAIAARNTQRLLLRSVGVAPGNGEAETSPVSTT